MKTELFLSLRYLKPERSAVGVITVISIIGVTLGVAVLMIVLAVMTGFTDLMKEKLLDTQAHMQVVNMYGYSIRRPQIVVDAIEKAGGTGVPVILSPVLLQARKRLESSMAVMGVNPKDFAKRVNIDDILKKGSFALNQGDIVISQTLARRHYLSLGDKILLHSPNKLTNMVNFDDSGNVQIDKSHEVYLPSEFTVAGIYSFNKSDFDSKMIFLNINDAADLYDLRLGSATHVYGYFDDPYLIDEEMVKVNNSLKGDGFEMYSWKDMNANLLGVLEVEKRMMFFLLIFIVLVAAFSITNTLITSVYKKTKEIGILKALGASSGTCMRVFVYQGMVVGIIGSFIGTLLGYLVILFRNDILHIASKISGRDLFPKEFYYFNELPAKIVVSDVAIIVVVSILLCTIGGIIPAIRAAKLDPAKALRYE